MSDELKAFLFYQTAAIVLALLLGKRSQIDKWCEDHAYAAAALKFLRAISLDPWMLIQALTLAVHKELPRGMGTPKPAKPVTLPPSALEDDDRAVIVPKPPEPPDAA